MWAVFYTYPYMLVRIFFLVTLIYSHIAIGQVDVNRFQNITQSLSSGSAAYGAGFQGVNVNRMDVIGDVYLDSSFTKTRFVLNNSSSAILTPARYDMFNKEFEVKTTGGVRILNGGVVKIFKVYLTSDSLMYVNSRNYTFNDAPIDEFLKVLSDGKIQLLECQILNVIKPTYNASLDVGDKNAYIKRKSEFYYSKEGKLFKLTSKKNTYELFGTEQSKVDSFVKANSLSFKRVDDLKKIFTFYNSLY